MKVAELERDLLNYWVARAEGWQRVGDKWHTKPRHRGSKDYPGTILDDWDAKGPHDFLVSPDGGAKIAYCGCESDGCLPNFSEDWAQGGPIIERELHGVERFQGDDMAWIASYGDPQCPRSETGPTMLIAAMRAYVASKFGDEVPDEG